MPSVPFSLGLFTQTHSTSNYRTVASDHAKLFFSLSMATNLMYGRRPQSDFWFGHHVSTHSAPHLAALLIVSLKYLIEAMLICQLRVFLEPKIYGSKGYIYSSYTDGFRDIFSVMSKHAMARWLQYYGLELQTITRSRRNAHTFLSIRNCSCFTTFLGNKMLSVVYVVSALFSRLFQIFLALWLFFVLSKCSVYWEISTINIQRKTKTHFSGAHKSSVANRLFAWPTIQQTSYSKFFYSRG